MTSDAEFARELAEEAGRILFERYERVEVIDHKSARDVVTEVDHLSEALILEAIRARHPGDGILAEESGAHHGSGGAGQGTRRRRATAAGTAEAAGAAGRALAHGRTWIVDPLDGTINYANGIPYFCVSIGLVVDGVPSAGAVHDPMRGETFWAAGDGPAMLGDAPIHASRKDKLSDFVVSMALGGRAVSSRARAVRKVIRASRNTGSVGAGAGVRGERAVRRLPAVGRDVGVGRRRGGPDRGAGRRGGDRRRRRPLVRRRRDHARASGSSPRRRRTTRSCCSGLERPPDRLPGCPPRRSTGRPRPPRASRAASAAHRAEGQAVLPVALQEQEQDDHRQRPRRPIR